MLGAVARQSICEAWQRGADRTAFHGYSIETRRIGMADDGHGLLVLTLRATGTVGVLDRLLIAVASHPIPGSAFPISFDWTRALASRRTESLVGCVSPFDARKASPETGQIS
jgi:hypothetical protein